MPGFGEAGEGDLGELGAGELHHVSARADKLGASAGKLRLGLNGELRRGMPCLRPTRSGYFEQLQDDDSNIDAVMTCCPEIASLTLPPFWFHVWGSCVCAIVLNCVLAIWISKRVYMQNCRSYSSQETFF